MKAVVLSVFAAFLINAAAALAWDHYTQRLISHGPTHHSSALVAHR
jgi:hypothetical protein